MNRLRLCFVFSLLIGVSTLNLVQAASGPGPGLNAGAILNYQQHQMGAFGQPSLFFGGPITSKDLNPPKDADLIQIQDGVLPSSNNLQGIIHTEDGHVYISPGN